MYFANYMYNFVQLVLLRCNAIRPLRCMHIHGITAVVALACGATKGANT